MKNKSAETVSAIAIAVVLVAVSCAVVSLDREYPMSLALAAVNGAVAGMVLYIAEGMVSNFVRRRRDPKEGAAS